MRNAIQLCRKKRLAEHLDETIRVEKAIYALAAFLQHIDEAGQARATLPKMPTEAKIDCITVLCSCFAFFSLAPDDDLACWPG